MPTMVPNPISPQEALLLLVEGEYDFYDYTSSEEDQSETGTIDFVSAFDDGERSGNILVWIRSSVEQLMEQVGAHIDNPALWDSLTFTDIFEAERNGGEVTFSIAFRDEVSEEETEVYEDELGELLHDLGLPAEQAPEETVLERPKGWNQARFDIPEALHPYLPYWPNYPPAQSYITTLPTSAYVQILVNGLVKFAGERRANDIDRREWRTVGARTGSTQVSARWKDFGHFSQVYQVCVLWEEKRAS